MRFARICGDRPFLPWELIDDLIEMAEQDDLDLASNVVEKTYPSGAVTEVVATRALRRILERSSDPQDREHLTRYIYANPKAFRVADRRSAEPGWQQLNLAIDNQVRCRAHGMDPGDGSGLGRSVRGLSR